MKKALVVLPTYNEAGSIEKVIELIFKQQPETKNWQIEILVVDSNSPDNTGNLVKALQRKYHNLYLISTPKEGLGKAYTKGFAYALNKLKPFVFVEMDSDLQHDPKLIIPMLSEIEKGADFVIGARYIKGGSIPQNWGIHRKLFSILGNLTVRLGFMNLKVHDWTNGYRAIKSWVIQKNLQKLDKYSGYVFQIATLDKALKDNAKIAEIPCNFVDRKKGVSKIKTIEFIFSIFDYLFRNSSFIKFVIVGFTGFLIDFCLSKIGIETIKAAVWLVTFVSAWIATTINYFLNNYWSFSDKKITGLAKGIVKYLQYVFVSIGNILIQAIGMEVTTKLFGINYWYIYKILIIAFLVIPYSYFMYNRFIWKKK